MKRNLVLMLATAVGLLAFNGLTQAKDKQSDDSKKNSNHSNHDMDKKHEDKHNEHHHPKPEEPKFPQIDPGKGDGKPADATPTKPGFVWVKDHWERAKASAGTTIVPNMGDVPTIRDHRGGDKTINGASGGVIVKPTGKPKDPINVIPTDRDHRNGDSNINGASGGVIVKSTGKAKDPMNVIPPAPKPIKTGPGFDFSNPNLKDHRGTGKPNDVIGVGPGITDVVGGAVDAVIGGISSVLGVGEGTITHVRGSGVVAPPMGPTIRDHR